jgi:hypothetical protein
VVYSFSPRIMKKDSRIKSPQAEDSKKSKRASKKPGKCHSEVQRQQQWFIVHREYPKVLPMRIRPFGKAQKVVYEREIETKCMRTGQ